MREIRTFAGLAPEQLASLVGTRQLIVWGGNEACVETLASLREHYRVAGPIVVLTMQHVGFERFGDAAVLADPGQYLAEHAIDARSHCVVVASLSYRRQIVEQLTACGFLKDRDYLFHHALFRPRLLVRLAPDAGRAIAVDNILDFVARHRQALAGSCVEVAGFPDPLAFAGIDDLLAGLDALGPLTVSTYMPAYGRLTPRTPNPLRLRLFALAREAEFRSLFPDTAWPRAEREIAAFLERIPGNLPTQVVRTGFTGPAPRLPERANFIYADDVSYPWDYTALLHYASHPTAAARHDLEQCCGFDVDAALAKARLQREKNCMCERVFPVFNADGVGACAPPSRAALLTRLPPPASPADIIAARKFTPHCRPCQDACLHRLDLRLLCAPHPPPPEKPWQTASAAPSGSAWNTKGDWRPEKIRRRWWHGSSSKNWPAANATGASANSSRSTRTARPACAASRWCSTPRPDGCSGRPSAKNTSSPSCSTTSTT